MRSACEPRLAPLSAIDPKQLAVSIDALGPLYYQAAAPR